jgi:hypothetical protein
MTMVGQITLTLSKRGMNTVAYGSMEMVDGSIRELFIQPFLAKEAKPLEKQMIEVGPNDDRLLAICRYGVCGFPEPN